MRNVRTCFITGHIAIVMSAKVGVINLVHSVSESVQTEPFHGHFCNICHFDGSPGIDCLPEFFYCIFWILTDEFHLAVPGVMSAKESVTNEDKVTMDTEKPTSQVKALNTQPQAAQKR